jgi:hypothetical protein
MRLYCSLPEFSPSAAMQDENVTVGIFEAFEKVDGRVKADAWKELGDSCQASIPTSFHLIPSVDDDVDER